MRLGSACFWCLVTKKEACHRGESERMVLGSGGEREGWKAHERTALISLPEERHTKGTGVTQSIQA